MELSYADAVHDMVDWVGQQIKFDGEQAGREAHIRKVADECLAKMLREELPDAAIREIVGHLSSYSETVATRLRAHLPAIFASGDDISLMYSGVHPASHTEQ